MTRHLIVMVKEPRPGRVKTRLGKDIGMVSAAWWFRHQTRALLLRLADPRWQLTLAVSPDTQGQTSRIWPAHLPRLPQGTGTLGDRMARAFRSMPPGPVCIIGADIPGIRKRHIACAFKALGDHDATLGPAPDGGYWLIGLKRTRAVPAGFLEDVRWSTEHARADTIATLGPLTLTTIDTLRDVDTAADLPASSG
ncbi:TIGR04282 family arsenosugar biosynthesis glycosyltransferase [Pseudaestuariivita sp.]|uniref:TIGR04282 family arsenosugar biosynthesis glycosyltransferase n=1 Tax=Pseudaestuariivita sp. TaxID=2211669 RepID=UPI0040598FC0